MPSEISLQPSPEQEAIIAARHADPGGSLRVVAFAGSGKTMALQLLAETDSTPALYLAYNKSTQLAAQGRFPAHVTCRTIHSLAYRALRMFEQQHRLERKLTGRELAEMLAIPALDGLRPSFWGQCVIGTVRSFAQSVAREIDARHLPPLPRGTDRAELVITLARELWARMRNRADEVPLEQPPMALLHRGDHLNPLVSHQASPPLAAPPTLAPASRAPTTNLHQLGRQSATWGESTAYG